MQPAGTDPLIGRVLESRYRIQARIAVGGMSTVYAAVDERLDREVAVKVMASSLSNDAVFVDRFAREARTAAKLSHVNAVAVYDQGADGSNVFLVMELVRGRTLRDLIRERGALSPGEAVSLMEPVLAALAAAHRAGLVHRDVKPENILLSDDGLVKVADFGLARAVETNAASTRTGLMMGTVAYSSPEQFRRGNADARSDVYSAGVVLFELLTGQQPHSGPDAMAVAYRHVHQDIAPPSSVQPGVPAPLDRLLARVTARDPAHRPPDAAAFLAELHDVRRELHLPVMPVPRRIRPGRGGPELRGTVPPAPRPAPIPGSAPRGVDPRGVDPRGVDPRGVDPRGVDSRGVGRTAPDPRFNAPGRVQHTMVATPVGAGPYPAGPHPVGANSPGVNPPGVNPLGANPGGPNAGGSGLAGPGGGPVGAPPPPGGQAPPRPARRRRRWLRTLIGAVVLLLVAAGITVGTWWFVAGRWASIPDVRRQSVATARTTLEAAGFHVSLAASVPSESVARGLVISTQPAQGERMVHGRTVKLTASSGPTYYAVPDLVGQSQADAERALAPLQAKGVRVVYTRRADDHVRSGAVISTDPTAKSTLTHTGSITVVVSTGLPIVSVPDVTKQTAAAATTTLQTAKFTVSTSMSFSDTIAAGSVISQTPKPTAKVREFSQVRLVISKGVDLVTVPQVPSLDPVADATAVMNAAGLTVTIQRSFGGRDGLVVGVDPAPGTRIKRGSPVTLYIV